MIVLDETSATAAAILGADRQARGRPIAAVDTLIAGVALSHGARIATRNVRHFDDLTTGVLDPWTAAGI